MKIGVLADTHVPDQLPHLPARAVEVLREHSCVAILHAGDICRRSVLRELSLIAPVFAVRGNRDLLWPPNLSLPARRTITFGKVTVGLTHGQQGIAFYLLNKISLKSRTEPPSATEIRLLRSFDPGVSVIVYGHSHIPRVSLREGTLILNPGSLAPPHFTDLGATLAVLDLSGDTPEAEVISVV